MIGPSHEARRISLVVAHPGHELRLYGWMRRLRPTVFVLTSGDGACAADGRVNGSAVLAARTGAAAGALFGTYSDRELYARLMSLDTAPFRTWTRRLADEFVRLGVTTVITDAWQGYSPAHDLAHCIARIAAEASAERLGRGIEVLEYPVVPWSMAPSQPATPVAYRMSLDDGSFGAKLAACAAFPGIAPELAQIVEAEGRDGLREETLHHPAPMSALLAQTEWRPEYERFGEERVAAGVYDTVLRWRHVRAAAAAVSGACDVAGADADCAA